MKYQNNKDLAEAQYYLSHSSLYPESNHRRNWRRGAEIRATGGEQQD